MKFIIKFGSTGYYVSGYNRPLANKTRATRFDSLDKAENKIALLKISVPNLADYQIIEVKK